MEARELLNVIDIIRNEKLYTERLNELKKVEESIKSARYVEVTMDQADRFRNEYEELKKQAEENLKCIEEEVESRVKDEKERLRVARETVSQEKQRLDKWATKLEEEQVELYKLIRANKQTQENLRVRGDEISLTQKQLSQEQNNIRNKVEQINKLLRS